MSSPPMTRPPSTRGLIPSPLSHSGSSTTRSKTPRQSSHATDQVIDGPTGAHLDSLDSAEKLIIRARARTLYSKYESQGAGSRVAAAAASFACVELATESLALSLPRSSLAAFRKAAPVSGPQYEKSINDLRVILEIGVPTAPTPKRGGAPKGRQPQVPSGDSELLEKLCAELELGHVLESARDLLSRVATSRATPALTAACLAACCRALKIPRRIPALARAARADSGSVQSDLERIETHHAAFLQSISTPEEGHVLASTRDEPEDEEPTTPAPRSASKRKRDVQTPQCGSARSEASPVAPKKPRTSVDPLATPTKKRWATGLCTIVPLKSIYSTGRVARWEQWRDGAVEKIERMMEEATAKEREERTEEEEEEEDDDDEDEGRGAAGSVSEEEAEEVE